MCEASIQQFRFCIKIVLISYSAEGWEVIVNFCYIGVV